MASAQHDQGYRPGSVDSVLSAFEAAVTDFERGWSALSDARFELSLAKSQMEYARACMEESDAAVDLAATQFNMSHPDAPDHYVLMAELDLASDTMMRHTHAFELAHVRHQAACDRLANERRNNRVFADIAHAMKHQLSKALNDHDSQNASNDPRYNEPLSLDHLSDSAYRFYKRAG